MARAAKKSAPKKSAPKEGVEELVESQVEAEVVMEEIPDEEEIVTQPMEEALAEAAPKDPEDMVYPEIECRVLTPDNPLTFADAKEWLGWEEPIDDEEFEDPDIFMFGKGIVLHAVQGVQRAIMPGLYERYAMEILHGNWAGMQEDETPNGETIVVGQYGHVLDGDHRLLGLCRAVEMYIENPDKFPFWTEKGEPYLTTVIISGISEKPRVLNTFNTGKVRSLSDAIHTSGLFRDFSKKEMKKICKAADFAIKTLWDHIGVIHAYGPRKSHAEALDFVLRHPKLIECVKSCFAEEPSLSETGVSTGAMAALLYLMAASKTNPRKKNGIGYYQVDAPSEKQIDFALYNKAEEFMIKFAQGDDKFKALYNCILNLTEQEDGKTYGIFRTIDRNILYEKTCLIFKTWKQYVENQPITLKTIGLRYKIDEEGEKFLNEEVTVAGIDLGITRKEEIPEDE